MAYKTAKERKEIKKRFQKLVEETHKQYEEYVRRNDITKGIEIDIEDAEDDHCHCSCRPQVSYV